MVWVKRLAMAHNVDTFILVATNKIQLSSHVTICYRYKVKLGKLGKNKNYVTIILFYHYCVQWGNSSISARKWWGALC